MHRKTAYFFIDVVKMKHLKNQNKIPYDLLIAVFAAHIHQYTFMSKPSSLSFVHESKVKNTVYVTNEFDKTDRIVDKNVS